MTEAHEITLARSQPPAEWVQTAPVEDAGSHESIFAIIFRRWKIILITAILLGGSSAASIWTFLKPQYEVSATLNVARRVQEILFADQSNDISRYHREYVETEGVQLLSPAVISATLNSPEVQSLTSVVRAESPARMIGEAIKVERIPSTSLLQVSMRGARADELATIVNTLLRTHLRLREERKRETDARTLRSLQAELQRLETLVAHRSGMLRQLAVDEGLGLAEGSGDAISGSVAEIRSLLAEAKRDEAVATQILTTLEGEDGAKALIDANPAEFETFVQRDHQWQSISNEIRKLESEAWEDEQQGRGPAHPIVISRPKQLADLQQKLDAREAHLADLYTQSTRRQLDDQKRAAGIAVKTHEAELAHLTEKLADVTRQTFELEDVRHERARLEQSMLQVQTKIWNLELEQNRAPRVTIDSLAVAPKKPNIDKRIKYMIAAIVASIATGMGLAMLRHRMDTSIRDPEEVIQRLGIPLLGSVQDLQSRNGANLATDMRLMQPLRGISAVLMAASRTPSAQSLLVTGPTAQCGKSFMATNLARSLASTGRQVLLVDGDNVGQGVTRALDMGDRLGLKEWLEGTCTREQAIHQGDMDNLQVLPAGERNEHFGAFLAREESKNMLRRLFGSFGCVIVDSPPVLASSDTVVLATLVEEVILILRAGRSTHEEVQAAHWCLGSVGSKVIGVILNAVDARHAPYYGYSGYSYSEATETSKT